MGIEQLQNQQNLHTALLSGKDLGTFIGSKENYSKKEVSYSLPNYFARSSHLRIQFFLDSISSLFWPFFKTQNFFGSNRFMLKNFQQSDRKSFYGKLMAEVTSVMILSMSMLAKILQSERKECKYFEASSCGHGSPRGTQSP